MKILWVTEHYPPLKGGMAVSCARLVRGLRRRGERVDVVSLGKGGEEVSVRAADGGVDVRVRRERELEAAPMAAWGVARERHAAERYDVVAAFGASGAGFLGVTLAAWLRVPAVVLARGNDLDRDWFLPRRGGWVREALERAAAVGAVSSEKVERIAGLYPSKTVVWTPNGVDGRRWELQAADVKRRDEVRGLAGGDERRVFGLFGELKHKKRIPFWLEAARDEGVLERISLVVAGQLDEETARILDDRAIAPRSVRLPFLPQDELAGVYAACDFVALPSSMEGMPNVLLEAACCGAVPLVSDAGAMQEVVEDGVTGLVFRSGDRWAAGAATRRAVEMGEDELRAMSRASRSRVLERFSPERELEILLELLRRAAG